jgi:transcriptional regulator with XRE-family HTH domain
MTDDRFRRDSNSAAEMSGEPLDDRNGSGGTPLVSGFAVLLRRYRNRARLTQRGLAQRAGVSIKTIRNFETGRIGRPRGSTMWLLAEALGLTDQERAEIEAALGYRQDHGGEKEIAPMAMRSAQLPPSCSSFTGRADELDRLDRPSG